MFIINECHLLWGYLLGYGWGRRDQRIEIPLVANIQEERERKVQPATDMLADVETVL